MNDSIFYNGAIAWIDILGYKDILTKNSIEEVKRQVIDKLIKNIETAQSIVNRDRAMFNHFSNDSKNILIKLEYIFFADTLVLYIDSNDKSKINKFENSVVSLCYAISLILERAFEENIALRGAITSGEFLIQKEPIVIIGKPIIEIVILEKSQEWAGVILSNELLKSKEIEPYITSYKVPLKNEICNEEFQVINWVRRSSTLNFDQCFNSKRNDVIVKKKNTIKFYNVMIDKL